MSDDANAEAAISSPLFRESQRMVVPAFESAVHSLDNTVRQVIEYHLGWRGDNNSAPEGRPKAMRYPAILLLFGNADNGPMERALDTAVACGLTEITSIIHDDVIDKEEIRYGRPTVQAKFGPDTGLLCGQALVGLAFKILSRQSHSNAMNACARFGSAIQKGYSRGLDDLTLEGANDVDLKTVLDVRMATAAEFYGCHFVLVAMCTGLDSDRLDHVERFGKNWMMALSLADDHLDLWPDSTSGHTVAPDLYQRKITAPIAYALNSDSNTRLRDELRQFYRSTHTPEAGELRYMANIIEQCGGKEWSHQQILQFQERATRNLANIRLPSATHDELRGLLSLFAVDH